MSKPHFKVKAIADGWRFYDPVRGWYIGIIRYSGHKTHNCNVWLRRRTYLK